MKTMEFSEILEKMLDDSDDTFSTESLSTNDFTHRNFKSKSAQTLDNESLSRLITDLSASTPVFKFQGTRGYFKVSKSLNATSSSFQLKAEGMTTEQFKAYEFMFYALEMPVLKAHQIFPEVFTSVQLKKAFKIAALKRHPDTGGSHESFLELKKSYELLVEFVRT